MKKIMLSSTEIDQNASDYLTWGKFIRRKEAEFAFSILENKTFDLALELGAGSGEQSRLIKKYCNKLICTENNPSEVFLSKKNTGVEFKQMDAQDLSGIGDQMMDLVFSSNMMEHIPDVDRCLQECCRVLKPGGVMLHIMPNRWWKFFYFWISIIMFHHPIMHGVSKTHWQEFRAFGASSWKKVFARNNLIVAEIVGLPFYTGHGPALLPLIKLGNWLGIPASYLYIIWKGR